MAKLTFVAVFTIVLIASRMSLTVTADDSYIISWINMALISTSNVYPFDPQPSFLTNLPILPVNNLQPVSLTNAEYYIYFAFAAYCPETLANWTCPDCLILGPNVNYVATVENNTYNTLAFLAVDDTKEEIILTYRGTFNLPNLLADVTMVQYSPNNTDIKIHAGFYRAQQSLIAGVTSWLDVLIAANPGYKVVVTGHSLGGVEAALTVFQFKYNGRYPGVDFELYTYGELRHGNKAYATKFNSFSFPAARVVNRADAVPHLVPYSLDYVHRGNEVFTVEGVTRNCSNVYYEDLTCSNSQGPLYSPYDHLFYFNAEVSSCLFESPVGLVLQLIINLQPYLPASLIALLKLNFNQLSPTIAAILQAYSPYFG